MPLDRQKVLNNAMPANSQVRLGDVVADLIAANNALATKLNGVLAKLDADVGVTGTDYTSLWGGAAQVTTLDLR